MSFREERSGNVVLASTAPFSLREERSGKVVLASTAPVRALSRA
jgi:hypothetical protein